MKAKELLLECKVRLKVSSDYALANALKVPRARIGEYMRGDRKPDEYACFRIAEALQRDPAEVIAQVNAETEGAKGEFFRDFMLRHGLPVVLVLSLSTYSDSSGAVPRGTTGEETAHNGTLWRNRRHNPRRLDRPTRTRLGGFFTVWRYPRGQNRLHEAGCVLRGAAQAPEESGEGWQTAHAG